MPTFARRFALALGLLASPLAHAGARDFVVYAPGLGGSADQAKPYLDTFFRELEKSLGWPTGGASGEFLEDAKAAETYIAEKHPGFGMIAPSMYLELACKKEPVEPIATLVGLRETGAAGRFHLVAKDPALKDLKSVEGKRLASNHLENQRFVSRVVFDGAIDITKYFQLRTASSPLKPLKEVDRGEADVALIDDAQLAHMKSLPFGQSLHVLFSSEPLPPFPVVAFTKAVKPAERDKVRDALLGFCATPSGGTVCKSLQITKFEPVDASTFRAAVTHYCKK